MLEIVKSEPYPSDTEIRPLRHVLREAMILEQASTDQYTRLSRSMEADARNLLEALAADGIEHAKALKSMLARADLASELNLPAPVRRRIVCLPVLPSEPEEEDILDYVEAREHLSFDMYDRIVILLDRGDLRSRVVRLRERKRQREDEARRCGTSLLLIF